MKERAGPRDRHLLESWHILRKRRWVVLTAVAVLFTTVTIGSFLMTPSYRATAVIQIERENPNIVNFSDIYARDSSYLAYTDFYQTQYRLIESRDVLRRVVERLDLPRHPAMAGTGRPGPLARSARWLRRLLPGPPEQESRTGDPLQPWVAALRGGLEVDPIKNTHLVEITFESPDAALAAAAANAVAEEYILFNTEVKSRTSGLAGRKLDGEIRNLSEEIERLDRDLRAFGQERAILELSSKKTLVMATLEELTRAATQARIQRARSQAAYESLRDARPDSLEAVRASPTIKDLKGRLADLEAERAEKADRFKPDYPDMVALHSQREVVAGQLAAEERRIRDQVVGASETAYRTALGEERRLTALEDEQKRRVQDLEQSLAEYESMKAALDAKKDMRAGLIKRRDETGVLNRMEETQAGNVWLVEEAQAPPFPYRPDKKLNILLSLVVGLGLGVGLAFFFEHLDSSVKHAEDLDRLGLPALGLIPTVKRRGHGKVVALDSRGRAVAVETITHTLPKGNHAEAYRDLRTTLLLSSPDRPPRLILITSAQPQEGKTVTCVNVALSLTQIGRRVLLLDADLRKPRIHKILEMSRAQGLSSFLAGNQPWRDLVLPGPVPGLFALTAGPIPPNPAELLASHSFRGLMEELRRSTEFDHVIVDTPPLLAVADPVIVAGEVDGVLLVVRAGDTPRQSVAAGLEKLRSGQARVLGAVLNNLDLVGRDAYAYRYGYRYGYDVSGEGQAGEEAAPVRNQAGRG